MLARHLFPRAQAPDAHNSARAGAAGAALAADRGGGSRHRSMPGLAVLVAGGGGRGGGRLRIAQAAAGAASDVAGPLTALHGQSAKHAHAKIARPGNNGPSWHHHVSIARLGRAPRSRHTAVPPAPLHCLPAARLACSARLRRARLQEHSCRRVIRAAVTQDRQGGGGRRGRASTTMSVLSTPTAPPQKEATMGSTCASCCGRCTERMNSP